MNNESEQHKELRKNKSSFFEQLFDNAQIGLMYIDADRTLIKANPRLAEMFKYDSAEEMTGLSMLSLHLNEENYIDFGTRNFDSLVNKINTNIEYPLRKKDGSTIWCLVSGKALDENNPADLSKGVLWSVSDISNLKQTQKALEHSNERWNTALNAYDNGIWEWDIETNNISVADKWKMMHGFDVNDVVHSMDQWNENIHPEDKLQSADTFNDVLSGKANKFTSEYRFKSKDGSYNWIMDRGIVVEKNAEGKPKRLIGTHHDISEKKSFELELIKSRNSAQQYLDLAGSLIIALDTHGDITLINTTGCKLLECSEVEMIGKNWFELFFVDDELKMSENFFSQLMKGAIENVEFIENKIQTLQGNIKLIAWHNSLIHDEKGNIQGLISSGRDITQERQLEFQLEDERKRFMLAIEGAQDGLWDWNTKTDEAYMSDRFSTMLGYEVGDLSNSGETLISLIHPDDIKKAREVIDEYFKEQGKIPYKNTFRMRAKDGTYKWISGRGKALFNEDGEPERFIGFNTDVSEYILLENELKDLNERMELALLGNNDGVWDWNIVDNDVYYSPRWKEMLGYTEDEIPNKFSSWEDRVHPDDLPVTLKAVQENIEGKSRYVDNEHRLRHKNGSWVWIHARARTIFDKNNNALRMNGTHTDITGQKLLEQELEESYSMLHKLTDNIPGAIYKYRLYPDGRSSFPYVSKGVDNIYGVSAEDVMQDATVAFKYIHQDDLKMVESSIQDSAQTMKDWDIEYRVNLPKKGLRWIQGRAKPEKLEDGSILGYGFINDITEQKNIRNQLEEEHKYLQAVIDGVDDPIMVIKEDYTVEIMNSILKKSLEHIHIADPENPKCYEVSHHRSTPCDGVSHPCPLKEVMESGKHTKVIHKHDTNKGINRSVELLATPLLNKEGKCTGIIESSRDITEYLITQDKLSEQKDILDYQAHHDALTGLPNRVLFEDRLQQSIEKSKRNNLKTALLFIDLDHFKEINDSLGHLVGDEVLKVVASRLKDSIRDEDTLARLGGDEFTIILGELEDVQDSSIVAKTILKTLSEPILINDDNLYISSSIGISIYPDDGISTQLLLKFADSAMYKAKDEGRNNYQYYNTQLTELAFERVFMESSLREAVKNREFVVYYQPQVNGIDEKLIGVEALVRWEHPTMGLLSPAKFISLAERTGLIADIDRFVMETAMSQIAQWYKDGLNPGKLAINIEIKHLKEKDFFAMLEALIKETKCKPEWIELEVNESQVMTHPKEAIKILQQISDHKIDLAIDDFGTGYSSLAYLKRLPIHTLKIDREFIRDLPADQDDEGITKAVIALAKSLNLKIIAEGVETKEQKDFLVSHGCENIQGHYYSKPVSANKLENILKRGNVISPDLKRET